MFQKNFTSLVNLKNKYKTIFLICIDIIILLLSVLISFSLRFGELLLPSYDYQIYSIFFEVFVGISIFYYFGLYKNVTRFLTIDSFWLLLKAFTLLTLIWVFFVMFFNFKDFPRSVFIINFFIGISLIGVSRIIAKSLLNKFYKENKKTSLANIAIFGAGDAGIQLAMIIATSNSYKLKVFVDDNPDLHGKKILGVKVLNRESFKKNYSDLHLSQVFIAIPSLTLSKRANLLDFLGNLHLQIKALPSFAGIMSGNLHLDNFQTIPISELLGRKSVPPMDSLLTKDVYKKVVLVTGAGGSIGSEIVRQVFALKPIRIVLIELSEYFLYKIENELNKYQNSSNIEIITILGSVENVQLMTKVCSKFKVDTIYHAAAYKHVPLIELNNFSGLKNNIFGTLNIVKAAYSSNVSSFVLISTDKAVRPTNIMGASKRIAELIVQLFAQGSPNKKNTKLNLKIVRFGNVLGSSGSVIPLFEEQIKKGGPVTVTDQNIVRYFMTIPEAAQLVIQAGSIEGQGKIFILEMGPPVFIDQLARNMILLSGLTVKDQKNPNGDIEVKYTGLRPGEKLFEELHHDEKMNNTIHPLIYEAQEKPIKIDKLLSDLEILSKDIQDYNYKKVYQFLDKWVEGFKPDSSINDVMYK